MKNRNGLAKKTCWQNTLEFNAKKESGYLHFNDLECSFFQFLRIKINSALEIENALHWSLDTIFHGDELALSDRNAALNQSVLNKACLSLLSKLSDLKGGTQKISRKRLRMIFGWSFNDAMSEALTLMDPYTLARSVVITPRKKRG